MHRNVRFKKTNTKWSKASQSVAAATLEQAFKVKLFKFLLSAPILSHTHITLSGHIGHSRNFIGNFIFQQNFISILLCLYS